MRALFSRRGLSLVAVVLVAVGCMALGMWLGNPWRQAPPNFGESLSPLAASERAAQPAIAEGQPMATADGSGPAMFSLASTQGIDAAVASPPLLSPVAAFEPLPPTYVAQSPEDAAAAIDDTTMARLQEIRDRLEQLGADYVVVETTDGTGRYRFHCRMLVDRESQFTRPFESVGADPLAAGEAVLRDVEAWRIAATANAARRK